MAKIIQSDLGHLKLRHSRQVLGTTPWFYMLLCLLCFGLSGGQADAVGLTAQVDRNTIPVGETFTLSLVFDGVSPAGAPNLPDLPNLRQEGPVGHSSSFTFVNGATESKVTYTYSLVPTQPG